MYVEYEHDAPFNRSLRRAYGGAGVRAEYDGTLWGKSVSLLGDVERVAFNRRYAARPDGTGRAAMFYTLHLDYDLPDNFSFTTEHLLITDDDRRTALASLAHGSEWDRIVQLNYQATPQVIASLYQEVDTFLDRPVPRQSYWAFQMLYEF